MAVEHDIRQRQSVDVFLTSGFKNSSYIRRVQRWCGSGLSLARAIGLRRLANTTRQTRTSNAMFMSSRQFSSDGIRSHYNGQCRTRTNHNNNIINNIIGRSVNYNRQYHDLSHLFVLLLLPQLLLLLLLLTVEYYGSSASFSSSSCSGCSNPDCDRWQDAR